MTPPMPARAHDDREALQPINAMLDLAEQSIRIVIEHGGEAALRARLERLLPAPPVPAPAQDPDRAIDLANVLTALRAGEGRRMTEAQFQAIANAKAFVMSELAVATGGIVRRTAA